MHAEINSFLTPKVVKVQEEDKNHSKVILEPLERGFGHTLGNALRRILLSSMPGCAITEVEIDGVLHEYSTIEGIQEDVIDVLLNLKGIAIRLHNRNDATLTINKTGNGIVTAGDIEIGHDVEIINPDHIIAHLNGKGELKATLKVVKGRGYQTHEWAPAEEDDFTSRKVGVLRLDTAFSPVKRVSYSVESARVEQRTDLDKLIIDIHTNEL